MYEIAEAIGLEVFAIYASTHNLVHICEIFGSRSFAPWFASTKNC